MTSISKRCSHRLIRTASTSIVFLLSVGAGCTSAEEDNNGELGEIKFSVSHAVAGVPHLISLWRESDATCFALTKSCGPDSVQASRVVAASCTEEGLCAIEGPNDDGLFTLTAASPGHSVLDVIADFPGEAGVHDRYPIEIGSLSELTAECVVYTADSKFVSRADCATGVNEVAVGDHLSVQVAASGIDSAGERFDVYDRVDFELDESVVRRGPYSGGTTLSLDAVAVGNVSVAVRLGELESTVQVRVYSP